MVCVQDEQDIQGPLQHGIGIVSALRLPPQHVHEIAHVAQIVVRHHVGQPLGVPIGHRRQRDDLPEQTVDLQHPDVLVHDIARGRVKGREGGQGADQHGHRVGVVVKPVEHLLHVLVHDGVVGDVMHPRIVLRLVRQFSMDKQVSHLQVVALLGELLDGVSPVAENPALPIDEGDGALARGAIQKGRVEAHEAEVLFRHLDILEVGPPDGRTVQGERAIVDRNLVRLAGAVVGDGETLGHHGPPSFLR